MRLTNPLNTPFRWNQVARRYIDGRGRFVPPQTVRTALDHVILQSAEQMGVSCGRLQAGAISAGQWQSEMAASMRTMHSAAACSATGGWAQMAPADWGRLGHALREQYAFLQRFALQIQSGAQRLDGRFLQRAAMYAQAARTTHETFRRREEELGGMTEERRYLAPAENCADCVAYAAHGWVPIGTLPAPGVGSACLSNCKCFLDYR